MTDKPLQGKSFVLTGKLKITRAEATACIERLGGRIDKKVGWNTSYMLVGERVGSIKMNAAREWNVPTITEEDLDNLIAGA